MRQVGDRIGAFIGADAEGRVLEFLGYGKYVGEEVPPADVGGFNIGAPCPKMVLDSGETIWGCEVWWASEDNMKEQVKRFESEGYTIKTVTMAGAREEAKKAASALVN